MKRLVYLGLILKVTLVAVCFLLASAAPAATIVVTTADDELNSDGDCSLREAIQAANIHTAVDACALVSGDSIITLPAGAYTLTLPGADEDANATGDLDITASLTINGAGADATVINGGSLDRVLHILTGTVSIQGVTITGGKTPDGAPNGGNGDDGGGLYVAANVTATLTNSSIRSNITGSGSDNPTGNGGHGGCGGGIYNLGTLTLDHSTVSSNAAGSGSEFSTGGNPSHGGWAGGLCNLGVMTLDHTIVSGNKAGNGGNSGSPIGGGGDAGSGGGIYNQGALTLDHSTVSGNQAGAVGVRGKSGSGGGLYNQGVLALIHSVVSNNTSGRGWHYDVYKSGKGGDGGGLDNRGTSVLIRSTVSNNRTGDGGHSYMSEGGDGGNGGAISNQGSLTLDHSAVHNNTTGKGGSNSRGSSGRGGNGGNGGGLYNQGTLTLSHSTVSSNTTGNGGDSHSDTGGWGGDSGDGGGFYNGGSALVEHSTVSNNTIGEGGNGPNGRDGYDGDGGGIYGTVQLANSLIAGNADPGGQAPDCSGQLDSLGYNLVETTTGCIITGSLTGNLIGTNPLLGPLADNGGGTQTHALIPGSPAIDQGLCTGATTDQRGQPRPLDIPDVPNALGGDGCDIGAYEAQLVDLLLTKTVNHDMVRPGQFITYTIAARNIGVLTTTAAVISDALPAGLTFVGPVTLYPPEAGIVGMPPTLVSSLTIAAWQSITVTVPVTVNTDLSPGAITNWVSMSSSASAPITASVTITVEWHHYYFPLVFHSVR